MPQLRVSNAAHSPAATAEPAAISRWDLGVAANALIGGSRKSIALQPLSVEGSVGIGVGSEPQV